MDLETSINALCHFFSGIDSCVVLSGAGVSTASGIPDYRDGNGAWKHAQPMQFGEFKSGVAARRRYWARSFIGWQRFSRARPNAAHRALAEFEASGKVSMLVTQNVDGLHRDAGSRSIIELHGALSKVRCLDCDTTIERDQYQDALKRANPDWHAEVFRFNPDGDAVLADNSHEDFKVPGCPNCRGIVKPDVVMFGESVPKARVERVLSAIDRAGSLLVVGSSLTVFSGFRFARLAHQRKMPIAIVNQGRTRADDLATLKVDDDCVTVLPAALRLLSA